MAERKTDAQRLEELDKKLSQLQEQKKAIQARSRSKEEKARTRRLIQNGALAEKFLRCENVEPADFEIFLKRLAENPQVSVLLPSVKSTETAGE